MLWKKIAETLLDESDSVAYVADMHTFELQYMNAHTKKLFGLAPDDQSYIGQKCYKLLQGMDEPCSFCKKPVMSRNSFYKWEHFNPLLQEHYLVRDKIITVEGKDYHLQLANQATEMFLKQQKVERQLEVERTLLRCIRSLESSSGIKQAMDSLLEIVTCFYDGDRCYLFENDYKKGVTNNTYEWAQEGVSKEIDKLQGIPLEVIDTWMHMFEERGTFYISDLDENVDKDSDEYRILEMQSIRSLIAVPLKRDDKIVGFFGVDNPKKNQQDFTLLSSITYFIQNTLDRRRNKELLERLSYEDSLTGLYNRNCFNQAITKLKENAPESLAVIYLDLNGLKIVNDTYGHEAGDKLIRTAAANIRKAFGKNTFRIGGDEFVALLSGNTKEEVEACMNILREGLYADGVKISVGMSYRDADVNVEEQMSQADKAMYAEKKARHREI